jgi:hypothetical protein
MFSLNEHLRRHVHLQEVLGFVGPHGNAIGEQALSSAKAMEISGSKRLA